MSVYKLFNDTICAPATLPGSGAVSLIRVSGPDSFELADKIAKCRTSTVKDSPAYKVKFAEIFKKDGSLLDEVLISVFRNPHSYTGEDSVEICCHASAYIVSEILEMLIEAGARMAEPGEFTKRAFVNGKMDLAQAEAVADLISSQNEASHKIAMKQMKGGFSSELKKMRDELLHIVSLMELELDFSEEEVEFADRSELVRLVDDCSRHIDKLIQSFRLGNAIKNGIPVAIVGAANAGKSTLLNALLGEERAIVSSIAGTTRDSIEETLNIDGHLFRFIDTAGLRETDESIELIGIERSYRMIEKADVVFAIFDSSADDNSLEESASLLLSKIDKNQQKVLTILNKIDINKNVNTYNNFVTSFANQLDSDIFKISAANNEGIDEIKEYLADYARKNAVNSGETMVTNLRHLEALKNAYASLKLVRDGLETTLPTDLVAQDIREAIYHLGSIVGEISTDEVLGNIFTHFCIGK